MRPAIVSHRSAAEIGHTPAGPRPLPPLGRQRTGRAPSEVDTVLDSGLRVIAVRRPGVPMVELRLRIPFAGEHPAHAARAELLAGTLLFGTRRRDRVEIDNELAAIGADVGAWVDPERLLLSGSALASGLPTMLDVLADILTGATYPDHELARERERLADRLEIAAAQPGTIAREALQRRRYGDHPVARETPKAEEVRAVTAAAVRRLHADAVVPGGATLVLVGDLSPARAVSMVERALSGWHAAAPAHELSPLPVLHGADLLLVHRPGAVQSQLRLSAAAVPRTDERYPALQLANLVFGGYFSSRLVENLREDKGYTYHASSYLEFDPHGAALLVETDTASEATAAALLEIRYELGRLGLVPPTESEVDSVRRYAIGSLLISLDTQSGLAATLCGLAGVGLSSEFLREHPKRLERVGAEDVARAAADFFAPTRFTGVVVGDADALGTALGGLGGVVRE